jgi:hypothetical protein
MSSSALTHPRRLAIMPDKGANSVMRDRLFGQRRIGSAQDDFRNWLIREAA